MTYTSAVHVMGRRASIHDQGAAKYMRKLGNTQGDTVRIAGCQSPIIHAAACTNAVSSLGRAFTLQWLLCSKTLRANSLNTVRIADCQRYGSIQGNTVRIASCQSPINFASSCLHQRCFFASESHHLAVAALQQDTAKQERAPHCWSQNHTCLSKAPWSWRD